jgi:hypothetical protein
MTHEVEPNLVKELLTVDLVLAETLDIRLDEDVAVGLSFDAIRPNDSVAFLLEDLAQGTANAT